MSRIGGVRHRDFFYETPFKHAELPASTATCAALTLFARPRCGEARGYYQPSAGEHACALRPFYASAHLAHALVRGRRGTAMKSLCCLTTRPALHAVSACARASRRVIEPNDPLYASLAARELSADGECARWLSAAPRGLKRQGDNKSGLNCTIT
ncbi:hypothetical protein T492DRAFT_1027036 [Pavlovales sp. CCMP2436]|nr:hypothetical protein T492DRAFT_1027036 [Pavlovales sp. CCMP2436]